MGFFRIFPSKDSWITNLSTDGTNATRATGSNHGLSPSLSVFAQKGEITSGSVEWARSLLEFSLTELSGKIYADKVIPSSSVSYVLKMFNMEHEDTVPTSYDLFVYPLSRSWDEGTGIDNVNFRDAGYVNWMSASSTQTWSTTGSDYVTDVSGAQHFDNGQEDLEINVTSIVNEWLTGSMSNRRNGIVLKLGDTEENNSVNYFVKKFHSRESLYVDRLPYLEARWSNLIKDNRKNFAYNNDNKLFLYNFVRGELSNLTEPVFVKIRDSLVDASASYNIQLTASRVETGIYSASLNVSNTTASFSASWYDVWFSGAVAYFTGTFVPLNLTASSADVYDEFVLSVTNLKRVYDSREEARLKVNVRKRDFKTHRGVVASASLDIEKEYIEKLYYSVVNDETGEIVVPFGTGSVPYTQLSYDANGNYFDLYMDSFVPGFKYKLKFLIDINRYDKKILDDEFVFKVV